MVRDEKITRSPLPSVTSGCSSSADARERRARFALAAGAKRHDLVGRQIAIGVDAAKVLHAFEIAGLARNLNHAFHRAADHDDFAPGGARGVGDGANARDI